MGPRMDGQHLSPPQSSALLCDSSPGSARSLSLPAAGFAYTVPAWEIPSWTPPTGVGTPKNTFLKTNSGSKHVLTAVISPVWRQAIITIRPRGALSRFLHHRSAGLDERPSRGIGKKVLLHGSSLEHRCHERSRSVDLSVEHLLVALPVPRGFTAPEREIQKAGLDFARADATVDFRGTHKREAGRKAERCLLVVKGHLYSPERIMPFSMASEESDDASDGIFSMLIEPARRSPESISTSTRALIRSFREARANSSSS
ncbi:hypothetical protein KM043_012512 [Ampulex compressa]|nr:hypothetical protein KM043_012512 [Ampulex compressa]